MHILQNHRIDIHVYVIQAEMNVMRNSSEDKHNERISLVKHLSKLHIFY